jgi:hypothetical protein
MKRAEHEPTPAPPALARDGYTERAPGVRHGWRSPAAPGLVVVDVGAVVTELGGETVVNGGALRQSRKGNHALGVVAYDTAYRNTNHATRMSHAQPSSLSCSEAIAQALPFWDRRSPTP